MYHCVPRIISGLSQMSGCSENVTMPKTATGNSRFAGNAARNCAIGCTTCATPGRMPTQTPIGTQRTLAMPIRTNTRTIVRNASPATPSASASVVSPIRSPAACQSANATAAATNSTDSNSERPEVCRGRSLIAPGRGHQRLVRFSMARSTRAAKPTRRERRHIVSAHDFGTRPPGS